MFYVYWGVLGYPGVSWGNKTDPIYLEMSTTMKFYCFCALYRRSRTNQAWLPEWQLWTTLKICINGLSLKALAGPCRTEPTVVTEVGRRRMMVFGTGF